MKQCISGNNDINSGVYIMTNIYDSKLHGPDGLSTTLTLEILNRSRITPVYKTPPKGGDLWPRKQHMRRVLLFSCKFRFIFKSYDL